MRAAMIFDYLNDLVFIKEDQEFHDHVTHMLEKQGLVNSDSSKSEEGYSNNGIMQLFSPLVTSHRVMSSQFNNPYKNIKLVDGSTVVFHEYLGYLVIAVGRESEDLVRLYGERTVHLAHLLCGPLLSLLKTCRWRRELLKDLLDSWWTSYKKEQCVLVEAVERLVLSSELQQKCYRLLQKLIEKGRTAEGELPPTHAFIFAGHKLVSMYSCRDSIDITPSDVLYLTLLCQSIKEEEQELLIFLRASQLCGVPYLVNVGRITDDITLLLLSDMGQAQLSTSICSLIVSLVELQRESKPSITRKHVDKMEASIKKLSDSLKRFKHQVSQRHQRQIVNKWETTKAALTEYLHDQKEEGACTSDFLPSSADNSVRVLVDLLQESLRVHCVECSGSSLNPLVWTDILMSASDGLRDYESYLAIKSFSNLTMNSCEALSINRYLEEFPGLVHFLYVDRSSHQLICPTLVNDEGGLLQNKVVEMVSFARTQIRKGNVSILWRDNMFNYTYFLWWEDEMGNPVRPRVPPEKIAKPLKSSGILAGDCYKSLMEACFPGRSVVTLELFCIHLELATPPCILEHSRRLAATVSDISPMPSTSFANLL